MKKTVKIILVVLVLLVLLVLGYKYFLSDHVSNINGNVYNNTDIVLTAKVTQTNQTLTITKYFSNDYVVDRWDWIKEEFTGDITHTYKKSWIYTVTLSLISWEKRRKFKESWKPLVPMDDTTVAEVKVISMPTLADWFWESEEEPWDNFFAYFNYRWIITSLPKWSFDTSKIKKVWNKFFASFNENVEVGYDRWMQPPPTSFQKWWLI